MCNCPKVTFYEVEFKLVGMKVIATHKNCGDFLNEDQFSQFEKDHQILGFCGKITSALYSK